MLSRPQKSVGKGRLRKMMTINYDFVPEIPLSPYSEQQFRAIKFADTGILNIFL